MYAVDCDHGVIWVNKRLPVLLVQVLTTALARDSAASAAVHELDCSGSQLTRQPRGKKLGRSCSERANCREVHLRSVSAVRGKNNHTAREHIMETDHLDGQQSLQAQVFV
jgi:hypothetical protein